MFSTLTKNELNEAIDELEKKSLIFGKISWQLQEIWEIHLELKSKQKIK